jgi:hypothetical protein
MEVALPAEFRDNSSRRVDPARAMSRLPSMFVRLSSSFAVSVAALLAVPETARAQRVDDLRGAVERVQAETGGRILSAETVRIGRGQIHRVKVLTRDGRVRVVTVQGDMLRERGAVLAGNDAPGGEPQPASPAPAAPPPPAPSTDEPRFATPEPPIREPAPERMPERGDPPDFDRSPRGEMPLPAFGERDAARPSFEPAPSPAFERHDPNLQQPQE